MQVLTAIDKEADLQGITAQLNTQSQRRYTEDTIRKLIETRLIPAGMVRTSPQAEDARKQQRSVLFFGRTIFTPPVVDALSKRFVGLFIRPVVWFLALASLVLLGLWYGNIAGDGMSPWSRFASIGLSQVDYFLIYCLLLVSFLFHEIGHAAASQYCGAKPAEIGFGMYLIFPVFYCNVTEIWRLPPRQRIVVSMGGSYFQLLVSAILVPFQLATDSQMLTVVIAANLFAVLMTLNPFLKFDGYWIYSDLFSIPNLRQRSQETIAAAVLSLMGGASGANKPTPALRMYAAGASIFFSGFAIFVASTTWDTFSQFPQLLSAAIANVENEPGLATVFNIMTGSGTYVLLLLGCLLTSLYICASIIRGIRILANMWSTRLSPAPGSNSHV